MADKEQNNQLQVILDEQNVPAENAKTLIEAFGAPFTEAGVILSTYKDIHVTDESQTEDMAKAKEMRLSLKRVRTGVENTRKELKDGYIKAGRAIDSVANFVKTTIQPAEEYLELQEKFVEIRRAELAASIKAERIEKLSKYTDDLSIYNFDTMREEAFDKLLADLEQAHREKLRKEKEEADRIEKERLDAAKRQKEIEAENARLKKEAEARETALAVERKKQEEAQAKIDAEKEKELLQERTKAESERKKREELEKAQRDREKYEADQKAQQEREDARLKREAEDRERAELLAPDKEKLKQFANGIDMVRSTKLPAVKSKQAQDIINEADLKLSQLFKYINEEANKL